ncbi:hypothetical protein B0H19DRAFT_1065470 [Mycena capillaripes]|nr:hypothetical protein B0H19DRAFT_1065470 [Mycena capillaripes]
MFPRLRLPVDTSLRVETPLPPRPLYHTSAVTEFPESSLIDPFLDVFSVANIPGLSLWTEMVKDKINILIKKAKENITMIVQTGAVDLKTKRLRQSQAWHKFFNVRDLIAARPNLQPVGLGNNDSGFDIDFFVPTIGDDRSSTAADDTQDLPSQLSDPVDIRSESDAEEMLTGPSGAGSRYKAIQKKTKPQWAVIVGALSHLHIAFVRPPSWLHVAFDEPPVPRLHAAAVCTLPQLEYIRERWEWDSPTLSESHSHQFASVSHQEINIGIRAWIWVFS